MTLDTSSLLRALRRPILWGSMLVVFVLGYSWMSPEITAPNERSRVYLTLALVESGEITIDDQIARYGKPFDVAKHEGHFYTDKAPGSSVLAVPGIAAYQAITGSESIEEIVNAARTFVMLPFALLTLVMLRATLLGLRVREPTANHAAIALTVGTSFLHYGAAFFGHALVACAAVGAALAMQSSIDASSGKWRIFWRVMIGLCGGIAFAIEYQAALLCIAIAIAYMTTRAHWNLRAVLLPFAGAMPPILATFLYNTVAFGGPLQTSYGYLHHSYSQKMHAEGLFGITFPTWEALYGLIFSPSRGVLLCAPIVALGLWGMGRLWRRCSPVAVYVGIGCAAYFLLVAGTSIWYGGWGFGPRLLLPIFGLAALPAALLLDPDEVSPRVALAARIYVVCGIMYNATVTATAPEIPHSITAPLTSVALPLLERGAPSPNLAMVWLGWEGLASLAPWILVLSVLCGYILASHSPRVWRRPRVLAACVMVCVGYATFAIGYPEATDARAVDRHVARTANLRVETK